MIKFETKVTIARVYVEFENSPNTNRLRTYLLFGNQGKKEVIDNFNRIFSDNGIKKLVVCEVIKKKIEVDAVNCDTYLEDIIIDTVKELGYDIDCSLN